jgi:hypothetical protein
MSIRFARPSDADARVGAFVFDAMQSMRGREVVSNGPITVQELYSYIAENEDPENRVEGELGRSLQLSRDFRLLLKRATNYSIPQVAAASSAIVQERLGEGCVIRVRSSTAEPLQTYILIELVGNQPVIPRALFVCQPDGQCTKFSLPHSKENIIQLLVENGSPLLMSLQDLDTEIFLR